MHQSVPHFDGGGKEERERMQRARIPTASGGKIIPAELIVMVGVTGSP